MDMPAIDVDFLDRRNSLIYWYPRIKHLDLPLPKTSVYRLDEGVSTFDLEFGDIPSEMDGLLDNLPVQDIIEFIENDLPMDKANIRSGYKSSQLLGGEGAVIVSDPEIIRREVMFLADSMVMADFPPNELVVREWVDIEVMAEGYDSHIGPEVRFIVDEGDVIGSFVDIYEQEFPISFDEDEATEIIDNVRERLDKDYSKLHSWAKDVAVELDETGWSIDFVQDVNGDWYLTDMGLYGLYWNSKKDRWHNISQIPADKPYNLAENLPEGLPERK